MAQNTPRRDQDKPSPVSMNLDTLEREGAPDPFVLILGGKRIMFSDAMEIDWRELGDASQDPMRFLKKVVPPDDQEAFFGQPMPAWKMNRLIEAYQKHYGLLAEPGE